MTPQQYTEYQLGALQQLADFRDVFYDENKNVRSHLLQKSINSFVDLFCQHHFANSDYSTIQKKPEEFTTVDEWISQFNIDTLLTAITYIIWTNKSHKGYLMRKIKDKILYKYLVRLNEILDQERLQLKIQKRNATLNGFLKKEISYQHP